MVAGTTTTDRAYERLVTRDARQTLRATAAVAAAISLVAAVVELAIGSPVIRPGLIAAEAAVFMGFWAALGRCAPRGVWPIGGAMGLVAMAGTTGFLLLPPHPSPDLAIVLVGIMPVLMAIIAMWPLREHVRWLAAATVVLLLLMLSGMSSLGMQQGRLSLVVAWAVGGVLSVVVQQAMERGRRQALRSIQRAHLGRQERASALARLRAVEAIGRSLSEHGPTPAVLEAAMGVLEGDLGYRFPSIYLGDDQLMHLGAHRNYEEPILEFHRGQGVIGRVMASRQPELIADVTQEPDFLAATSGVRGEVCIPLLAGDRFLGVLNVESAYEMGPDDLASISIVGDRFAAAIALANRRSALQEVIDASPLPIVAFEADERVAVWNRAATEVFGWRSDEVLGRPSPILGHEPERSRDLWAAMMAGTPVHGAELLRAHKDGRLIPVRAFATRFGDHPPYGFITMYQDLSAEQAAEAALAASETRFQVVVGALQEGIIVQDLEGVMTWVNAAAERITGLPASALVGRTLRDAVGGIVREDGLPVGEEDRPSGAAVRTGAPTEARTFGLRRHDGVQIWVETRAVPLRASPTDAPSAVVSSISDITDRKQHADELRRAERRVAAVLEQASDAIVGVDRDGRITFANPAAGDLFGYEVSELVGSTIESLVPYGFAEQHAEHRRAFVEQPAARPMGVGLELSAQRRDGGIIPVEVSLSPVETPTGLEIYATVTDVTERRRIEADVLQAAKMDSIGRLAGGIAHDFNNILTAITGYAEIVEAALPPSSPSHADVVQIVDAAGRAAGLTRQLLGFARKTVLSPADHDLNALITSLEPFLNRLLGEQVALVVRLDPDAGWVKVDRSQMDQIVVNLAVNARDAMPDGGTLVIETTAVAGDAVDDLLGLRGDRLAMLRVSDTGVGMTEAVRAHVFEPFFTTKPFGQGTGLGLATTYGIVRQSGGAITVDSVPGSGTTFTILLPNVPASTTAAPATGAPGHGRRDGTGTILVVEDEDTVRALVVRMLERGGHRVLQAPNGTAAMSLVGSRIDEVDLVLTDVVMPGMRGPELVLELRRRRPELPAILMSGYLATDVDFESDPTLSGLPLLTKPFDAEQLLEVVALQLAGA
jgi:PAS domain S-box-containing protein